MADDFQREVIDTYQEHITHVQDSYYDGECSICFLEKKERKPWMSLTRRGETRDEEVKRINSPEFQNSPEEIAKQKERTKDWPKGKGAFLSQSPSIGDNYPPGFDPSTLD